jgi:hypothetical protein
LVARQHCEAASRVIYLLSEFAINVNNLLGSVEYVLLLDLLPDISRNRAVARATAAK